MTMQRIPRTTRKARPFDKAFEQLAAVLRREIHNDASLFAMIAHIIPEQPAFAMALASNISRVLEAIETEVDYVEVLVEAYRRTLFAPDEDHGGPSLDLFDGDAARAEAFARNMCIMSSATVIRPATNRLN